MRNLLLIAIIVIFLLFTIYILFFQLGGMDVSNKFKTVKKITIYDISAFEKVGDINEIKNVTLDESITKKIFQDIKFHKGTIVWKGNYLGVAKLSEGDEICLAISYYGGLK